MYPRMLKIVETLHPGSGTAGGTGFSKFCFWGVFHVMLSNKAVVIFPNHRSLQLVGPEHPHYLANLGIEGLIFVADGDAYCDIFLRYCYEKNNKGPPPPKKKQTEPATNLGKTHRCCRNRAPTNKKNQRPVAEVETQCCRYDHLDLWLRARSGCYDSGRTTTCDRYTWCGCGNGIYLHSRRKVVKGGRHFVKK